MPSAVIAEADILLKHGAILLENEISLNKGILYHGWTFRSFHDKMADEQELINLQIKISERCGVEIRNDDVIVIDGHNLHIPPMIFLKDILTIKHQSSSTQFDFSAADAICSWAIKHTKPNLEILEVPYAKHWTIEQTNEMKQHKWDWTYCSDYNCTVTSSPSSSELSSIILNEGKILGPSINSVPSTSNENESNNLVFIECLPGGIDLNLLRAQDDILFYDDFILYQDDLQDCGETQFSVKIRVMPTCWFVLSRLFLRVDGSRILIKDTRLFHSFNSNKVFMEITTRQGVESDYLVNVSSIAGGQNSIPSSLRIPVPPSSSSLSSTTTITTGAVFPPSNVPYPNSVHSSSIRSISGTQLRDSNFMSKILPLKSYLWKVINDSQKDQSESESVDEFIQKPQLDFYFQIE